MPLQVRKALEVLLNIEFSCTFHVNSLFVTSPRYVTSVARCNVCPLRVSSFRPLKSLRLVNGTITPLPTTQTDRQLSSIVLMNVRFEVFTAVLLKIKVSWDVMLHHWACSSWHYDRSSAFIFRKSQLRTTHTMTQHHIQENLNLPHVWKLVFKDWKYAVQQINTITLKKPAASNFIAKETTPWRWRLQVPLKNWFPPKKQHHKI